MTEIYLHDLVGKSQMTEWLQCGADRSIGGDLLTVESSFSIPLYISPQTGGDQANSCAQYQPPGFSCVVTKTGISRGRSR